MNSEAQVPSEMEVYFQTSTSEERELPKKDLPKHKNAAEHDIPRCKSFQ
jgi:hypothetical protein